MSRFELSVGLFLVLLEESESPVLTPVSPCVDLVSSVVVVWAILSVVFLVINSSFDVVIKPLVVVSTKVASGVTLSVEEGT